MSETRTVRLGATHYVWRPDVAAFVRRLERRVPGVKCNTYRGHPWQGWDHVSVDVWDDLGRGFPLSREQLRQVKREFFNNSEKPPVRHWIASHTLWTSFGGYSRWGKDDHSGILRHFHVTFWL